MGNKQIRTFLALKEGDKISVNDNATFNGSDIFVNRINTYDEKFRASVMTFINDAIGIQKWAIIFMQDNEAETDFVAFIWVDTPEEYNRIVSILLDKITFKKINPYYKGKFAAYSQSQL